MRFGTRGFIDVTSNGPSTDSVGQQLECFKVFWWLVWFEGGWLKVVALVFNKCFQKPQQVAAGFSLVRNWFCHFRRFLGPK